MIFIFFHSISDPRKFPHIARNFLRVVLGWNRFTKIDEFSFCTGLCFDEDIVSIEGIILRIFNAVQNRFIHTTEFVFGLDARRIVTPNDARKNRQFFTKVEIKVRNTLRAGHHIE